MSAVQRLIALDLDGTVLLEDETFSPGVVDAVAAAEHDGNIVTIATGRGWDATARILHGLGIRPDYVVCSNGAAIMSRNDAVETGYERHATETFDPSEVLELLEKELPDATYLVELPDGSRLYTSFVDDWDLRDEDTRRVTLTEMRGREVARVVVVSADHTEEDFVRMVEEMGLNQVSYAVGWTAWLDIAPAGVNKSTALEQVRELLGMPRESVVVIGDGRNDIGMFEWAAAGGGRAFAMGQAPDEVSQAATDITDDVEDGGVAAALEAVGIVGR